MPDAEVPAALVPAEARYVPPYRSEAGPAVVALGQEALPWDAMQANAPVSISPYDSLGALELAVRPVRLPAIPVSHTIETDGLPSCDRADATVLVDVGRQERETIPSSAPSELPSGGQRFGRGSAFA